MSRAARVFTYLGITHLYIKAVPTEYAGIYDVVFVLGFFGMFLYEIYKGVFGEQG